ncbi:hypothetical protein IT775_21030 [Thalassobius aquimarinus]|uniref:Uncharacterized protein n=1 Tax=Thalassovita aquimarina TaxID=2785917 RepID=A0ABS5HX99_9RHOB|nr:hypothetical protein [Thalassovita aquimarina]
MHRHHKKALLKLLSCAKDEDFLQLLWATNILQTQNAEHGLRFLDRNTVPPEAIGAEVPNPAAIYKWEIETLANEVLTTQKKRGPQVKWLYNNHYGNALACAGRLRKLENKELKLGGFKKDIWLELARIANRQFPWQVGSDNLSNIYRHVFVYGQGKCAEQFEQRYGVSIADFTRVRTHSQ